MFPVYVRCDTESCCNCLVSTNCTGSAVSLVVGQAGRACAFGKRGLSPSHRTHARRRRCDLSLPGRGALSTVGKGQGRHRWASVGNGDGDQSGALRRLPSFSSSPVLPGVSVCQHAHAFGWHNAVFYQSRSSFTSRRDPCPRGNAGRICRCPQQKGNFGLDFSGPVIITCLCTDVKGKKGCGFLRMATLFRWCAYVRTWVSQVVMLSIGYLSIRGWWFRRWFLLRSNASRSPSPCFGISINGVFNNNCWCCFLPSLPIIKEKRKHLCRPLPVTLVDGS